MLKVEEIRQLIAIPGGSLFHTPEFQALKQEKGRYFVLRDEQRVLANCVVHMDGTRAISGYRAPFGSVDYVPGLPEEGLKILLTQVIEEVRESEALQLVIKEPPTVYRENNLVYRCFEKLGFEYYNKEINQVLVVDERPYRERIRQKERNRLNLSEKKGYSMQLLETEQLATAYRLIQETHGRKGFPVTMALDEIIKAFTTMPVNYFAFGLFDADALIAVVLSVKVTPNILYNFFHADKKEYRTASPLVMLLGEVYKFCQKQGIGMLDMGISSVEGRLNPGLFKFKENLGCDVTEKITYQLTV